MKMSFLSRSLHKWLGLLVGLQILIWLITGLYMVIIDIDFIHGDSLVRNTPQSVQIPISPTVSMTSLQQQYGDLTSISLQTVLGKSYYLLTSGEKQRLIDPDNGTTVSPLSEHMIQDIALHRFNGDGPILKIELLTRDPPGEIRQRPLPLWRVDFDDRFNTSFYIHPDNGSLVTRRHQFWRIFDFFFMLHIMDYDERSDAHNLLLKIAQFVGTGFAITGLWLLFYSFSRRRKVTTE